MIESTVFLGAVIVGVTQLFKLIRDKEYDRAAVIIAAVVAGALLALVDVHIGVKDVSVAEGILIALGAAGGVTVASKVG